MSIPEFVRTLEGPGSRARRTLVGFFAHELAHRYFGWTLGAGSPQRDLFGEPFATYLEMKAIRHFHGEEVYAGALRRLRDRVLRGAEPTPLPSATFADFALSSYRYGYLPVMLLTLEAEIGEIAMRRLLGAMVAASPTDRYWADYEFIARTARDTGVPAEQWRRWEERCLTSSIRDNPCVAEIDGSRAG
jgi:hypothetical protein